MKKVFISCAVILASALGTQALAQQAQTSGSKEYNVHYTQDIPFTSVKEQDKKLVALDKQFKAYETAANKNDKKNADLIKANIVKWKTDNQTWIDGLESHLQTAVNGWYENSFKSLRLYADTK